MSQGVTAEPKWILVVSHEPTIRDVLERFLCVNGHFVLTAVECEKALDKARLMPVRLVVLDIDLPLSGGLTAHARFKSEPFAARLPLLLISSRISKDGLQKMVSAKDSFLTVPFTFTEVRKAVDCLLKVCR